VGGEDADQAYARAVRPPSAAAPAEAEAGTAPGAETPAPGAGSVLAGRQWIENRPSSRFWPRLGLRELWDYRDVGIILAERDLKVRYKQTYFGVGWAVMQPLIGLALFTLVLGRGLGIPSEGVPYAAFAMAGLAIWFPFNTAMTAAAESLVRDPQLVTKVYFPRLLAPLAGILAPAVDLVIALVLAVAVALIAGVDPRPEMLLLPAFGIVALVVSAAFGVWLSALNVLYRDVRYALGFVMQLLFFASPVVYPSSIAGTGWDYLLALNPLAGLIDLVRWSVLGVPAPGAGQLAISLAATLVLLGTGLLFFRRTERQFADRI
jgi:lipopolysaccharide transport system permease protein